MTSNTKQATDVGMKRILWLNIWTKSAKQIRGWKINYDTIEIALVVDTVQLKFQLLTNYKWLPKDLVTDRQKLHSNDWIMCLKS